MPIYAQDFALPAPGQMVALSPPFSPAVLKGIKLDPKNPFRFHFFVDRGDSRLSQEELKNESAKLIKYFLASLTIPEKDLWVNLSLLKQITASLIYPESQLGKEFWNKVYAQAEAKYGTTNIPINTFNKVWIVPDKAVVYENGGTAFVLENHLKVMLEQDYLSLQKHKTTSTPGVKAVIREIVIPALTKEVNEGKNFSQLRQVFYSLILATWYKKKIKDSILNKIYSNQNKIGGVNVSAQDKDRIYQEYLKAFKKGVFNYIQEEPDQITGQTIPRKYFSGGLLMIVPLESRGPKDINSEEISALDSAQLVDLDGSINMAMTHEPTKPSADGAMKTQATTKPVDQAKFSGAVKEIFDFSKDYYLLSYKMEDYQELYEDAIASGLIDRYEQLQEPIEKLIANESGQRAYKNIVLKALKYRLFTKDEEKRLINALDADPGYDKDEVINEIYRNSKTISRHVTRTLLRITVHSRKFLLPLFRSAKAKPVNQVPKIMEGIKTYDQLQVELKELEGKGEWRTIEEMLSSAIEQKIIQNLDQFKEISKLEIFTNYHQEEYLKILIKGMKSGLIGKNEFKQLQASIRYGYWGDNYTEYFRAAMQFKVITSYKELRFYLNRFVGKDRNVLDSYSSGIPDLMRNAIIDAMRYHLIRNASELRSALKEFCPKDATTPEILSFAINQRIVTNNDTAGLDEYFKNLFFQRLFYRLYEFQHMKIEEIGDLENIVRIIDYLQKYLNDHPEGFGVALKKQLADVLIRVGPHSGSYLHTLIRQAKEKGIITEQERNSISGAQMRWEINTNSNLLNGVTGRVQYGVLGYSEQGAVLEADQHAPKPSVTIKWKDRFGQGFLDEPPLDARYWPAAMVDANGENFDFISYLGEPLPLMNDFEPGIVGNGKGPLSDPKAEANRRTESWQYFKFSKEDVPRRRPTRTIWQADKGYHVVFLGFTADFSYALYQIPESGAVFRACINVSDFKQRIREAKNHFDPLSDEDLSKANQEMALLQKQLYSFLEEITPHKLFDQGHGDDVFINDLRKMLGYLVDEGYVDQLDIEALKNQRDIKSMEDEEVVSIAEEFVKDMYKRPEIQGVWKNLIASRIPVTLTIDLLGYRLSADTKSTARYLNKINPILKEHGIGQIPTKASAQQVKDALIKIKNKLRDISNNSALLKALTPFFSFNEFEWLKAAGESLTIGQVSDAPGVSHYPVFVIMNQVSRPIEYEAIAPSTHFAYLEVGSNLSDRLANSSIRGRKLLLGQGRTVRELLKNVGISEVDKVIATIREDRRKEKGNATIMWFVSVPVGLDQEIKEQDKFKLVRYSLSNQVTNGLKEDAAMVVLTQTSDNGVHLICWNGESLYYYLNDGQLRISVKPDKEQSTLVSLGINTKVTRLIINGPVLLIEAKNENTGKFLSSINVLYGIPSDLTKVSPAVSLNKEIELLNRSRIGLDPVDEQPRTLNLVSLYPTQKQLADQWGLTQSGVSKRLARGIQKKTKRGKNWQLLVEQLMAIPKKDRPTQEQLAEQWSVTQPTVSKILSSHKKIIQERIKSREKRKSLAKQLMAIPKKDRPPQKQLAEQWGVTQPRVSKILSKYKKLSDEAMNALTQSSTQENVSVRIKTAQSIIRKFIDKSGGDGFGAVAIARERLKYRENTHLKEVISLEGAKAILTMNIRHGVSGMVDSYLGVLENEDLFNPAHVREIEEYLAQEYKNPLSKSAINEWIVLHPKNSFSTRTRLYKAEGYVKRRFRKDDSSKGEWAKIVVSSTRPTFEVIKAEAKAFLESEVMERKGRNFQTDLGVIENRKLFSDRVVNKAIEDSVSLLPPINKVDQMDIFQLTGYVYLALGVLNAYQDVNAAMNADQKGGIDLNPAQMSMQIKTGSPTETFGDDSSFNIDSSQVTGVTFTIRTMTPVTNLPQILGLKR